MSLPIKFAMDRSSALKCVCVAPDNVFLRSGFLSPRERNTEWRSRRRHPVGAVANRVDNLVGMTTSAIGTLDTFPATSRTDLLAEPVAAVIATLPNASAAAIDADLADTAAFCEAYGVSLAASANCVVLTGKRDGVATWAVAVVLATTRADVNGVIRRHLNLRKVSFAPMEEATTRTGMEYGGITPIGLPEGWPILIDAAVVAAGPVVVGSGLRRSKVVLDGADLATLPGAVVLEKLAKPIG